MFVLGHVYACARSCICLCYVMYMFVLGHVYVCARSCICLC
jgi:hypothetical protein